MRTERRTINCVCVLAEQLFGLAEIEHCDHATSDDYFLDTILHSLTEDVLRALNGALRQEKSTSLNASKFINIPG